MNIEAMKQAIEPLSPFDPGYKSGIDLKMQNVLHSRSKSSTKAREKRLALGQDFANHVFKKKEGTKNG